MSVINAKNTEVLDMGEWLGRQRKKFGIDTSEFSPERERRLAIEYMDELGMESMGRQFNPSEVLSVKRSLETCKGCEGEGASISACAMGGFRPVLRTDGDAIRVFYAECIRRAERCRQEEIRRMMDSIPAQLKTRSFENFRVDDTVSGSVKAAARMAWNAAKDGRSLVLAGDVGTGKTHLAAAIAIYAMEHGKTVLFSTTPKLMNRLKSFGPAGDYQKVLETATCCDVLALDDFGAERYSDWVSEQLFTVVNDRYLAQRQTIITTNITTPEELIERMDYADWRGNSERTGYNGARIVSRICEMGEWVRIVGADQRLKRARKKPAEKAS